MAAPGGPPLPKKDALISVPRRVLPILFEPLQNILHQTLALLRLEGRLGMSGAREDERLVPVPGSLLGPAIRRTSPVIPSPSLATKSLGPSLSPDVSPSRRGG